MEPIIKPDKKSILKNRARSLAMVPEDLSAENCLHIAVFSIGNELFGIETVYIHAIIPLKECTPLPGAPSFVNGIINVRGQIMALFNPCEIFQIKRIDLPVSGKIMILESPDHQNIFGITVDSIDNTRRILLDAIKPIPQNISGSGTGFIRGISSSGIALLDAPAFISSSMLIVNQSVEH